MEEHIYKLKKLLKELGEKKGRHTELVSVYIPKGSNLQDAINMISQERTLTENVKNKTVRNNVIGALEKISHQLKLYKKTPSSGLAVFAGNVSENEGQTDIKVWTVEPPEPLHVKKYWCDQKFELEPLQDMVAEKELFGLLVLDNKDATIGLLKGKGIEVLKKMDSIVPGKFRKGGQSAQRFERVREGLINDWYKMIAERSREYFSKYKLKGILVGGPGPAKEDFLKGEYLMTDMRKLILGIRNLGYTDEQGLEELVQRSHDLLAEAAVAKEKALVKKFFEGLRKESGMVVYGNENVMKALRMGAVETILISEGMETEELVEEVKEYGTEIEIISKDSREGEQLFELCGIAGFLRWKIS